MEEPDVPTVAEAFFLIAIRKRLQLKKSEIQMNQTPIKLKLMKSQELFSVKGIQSPSR